MKKYVRNIKENASLNNGVYFIDQYDNGQNALNYWTSDFGVIRRQK